MSPGLEGTRAALGSQALLGAPAQTDVLAEVSAILMAPCPGGEGTAKSAVLRVLFHTSQLSLFGNSLLAWPPEEGH